MDITRPQAPMPYDLMPPVPSFTLSSPDLSDGQPMDPRFTQIHDNISPALEWSGFPEETQSFVVSCFDPDAPTPSGWWHWTILDVPVTMTHLEQGAGASDLTLDGPAFHLRNDSRQWAWSGPYPPQGDGPHRYVFAVHALDVDSLGLDDETPATEAAANVSFHCIARATLTATYEVPA